MATVREHFDTDAKALNAQTGWSFKRADGTNEQIILGKISYCFEENAKYWSFYFSSTSDIGLIEHVLNMPDTQRCVITEEIQVSQTVGYADSPERFALDLFRFTGRVYLYIDAQISLAQRKIVTDMGDRLGLSVMIRDREYVEARTELSKPLAFISHDSRDKDELVRGLALEMSKLLCSVWYDEYSLNVGASLRESIERGLKEAKKCIIILSPNFLSNNGWTKAEFDSIYAREIQEKKNVILPVWHNVGKSEVYEYCSRLTDRVALSSSLGVKELARRLAREINN